MMARPWTRIPALPLTPTQAEPLLRAENISKRFGRTRALDNVSVAFFAGEVHALMGENGAGKSTLGKIIAGVHRQDLGTIWLRNGSLPPGSVQSAAAAGVRLVHQELAQCPHLSVAENLCLHAPPRSRLRTVSRLRMLERAATLLESLEPTIDPRAPLGSLSPGHRQIVQIAAALDPSSPPSVIIFDEPTSSLSAAETERLLAIVRRLAAQGLAVIYVSHRMAEIFACCDRITVLRDGCHIATTRTPVIDEPSLVEQMIGRKLEAVPHTRAVPSSPATPALTVHGLSTPGKLRGISLELAPGEILGVGGLVGAGRSELLDAIFGLDPRARGRISVLGRPLRPHSPVAATRAGIGYTPEDRKLQGLFFELSIADNLVLPVAQSLAPAGLRSPKRERSLAAARLSGFQIKAPSPRASPATLSGGNQQKVLLARWMTQGVRILLLDEPTRGIDVGTKAEIHRMIRAAADRGTAILLVSSEMPELLALSDRILVMSDGRLTGDLSGREMTQAGVLRLATDMNADETVA